MGVPSLLGLYDLLAPQFLLGFTFPAHIDKYLSLLAVADFQTTSDENAVLYTGTVYFPAPPGQQPTPPSHVDPSGAVFDFHDFYFDFRLLIPRSGASFVTTAVNDLPTVALPPSLQPLKDNVFGTAGSPAEANDAPGVAFQLELLVQLMSFHLGKDWLPAVQNADLTISANPGSPPHSDVEIQMPQILLRYTQSQDFSNAMFEVAAWGDPGFDAPNDLAEGQLATMVPPLAMHSSGRFAFGIDTIVLDLSQNGTPPEILQFFGTDESFEGVYVKAIQAYYVDTDKSLSLNFAIRNLLVSFSGDVWLDAEVDLIRDQFTVAITAYDASQQLAVNSGSEIAPLTFHGGALTMPSSGVLYLQVAGGLPPYKTSAMFSAGTATPPPPGQELWSESQRLASPASVLLGAQTAGTLLITITDSAAPTPQKYINSLQFTITQSTGCVGTPPTPPGPPSNPKPKTIRRLSAQLRLEQTHIVLAEISGEIAFASQMQSVVPGGSPPTADNSLGLTATPAATKVPTSPPNGLLDFTLSVVDDRDTDTLTETLTLGAVPADLDGLYQMTNPSDNGLKDVLGAICIFTPILSAATSAIDPSAAGNWEAIAVDLSVPVALGALDIIRTTSITLYGGSGQAREESGAHINFAVTADYGVEFGIFIPALGIHSRKSAKIRYKAVGVTINRGLPTDFQIVFDTSKGYTLDLSDPGLFELPGPLADVLKIAGASIARFNPLTLEVDMVIKADLGIITVDKFKLKVPLDGSSAPSITPSGIKVNIPKTITGSGSVNISDGGFEGTMDLTICPIGLRMVASVGVQHVTDGAREATAFFFGFEVDFKSPIALGTTGLSLYGVFGLFGMHYDRALTAPVAGDAVGPDLRWLMSTKGQPYLLEASDGTVLWTPKIDNWAFGVGAVLGSSDGYLLTMRGMLLLELPGPRIIITVNLKIVEAVDVPTPTGMDTTNLDTGVIGILDIDVGAGQITLGVMLDFEIQKLISIQIPIQLYYNWNNPSDWHLWIGTIQSPASAKILGIVRGGGYMMMGGQAIQPFPPGSTTSLPGVAVALGINASVLWGSETAGVYLKVALSANFGVSFTPSLFILGNVHLEGSLHLLVVDIGVTGDFTLTAPNPVNLHVHVCGKIGFWFFHISACVDFGSDENSAPPPLPPLISNMYLQSFAPVIAQGQGDRPIDSSLGNAVVAGTSTPLPVVPIDSVPVIQMLYGVDVSTVSSTFTAPLPACTTFPGAPGVNMGGSRFAQYQINSLMISPPLPSGSPAPPVAWRPNQPASDTSQTQVDLALFNRNPNVTNSALERSDKLTGALTATWGDVCATVAPATSVFWAFCGQQVGSSANAWTLTGIPWPDPPNTVRQTPVPVSMTVTQPSLSVEDKLLLSLTGLLGNAAYVPAQVIGYSSPTGAQFPCLRAVELPYVTPTTFQVDLSSFITGVLSNGASAQANAQLRALVNRFLQFDIGTSQRIRMLLGVNAGLYKQLLSSVSQGWVGIAELDAGGTLVKDHTLPSLSPQFVTTANSATTLPSTWITQPSPWLADVVDTFLTLEAQVPVTVLLVDFVPQPTTVTLEVIVVSPVTFQGGQVWVGAIESFPTSEVDRVQNQQAIQQSNVETITTYLGGGTPVPLLEPDTEYTITVTYDALDTEPGSSTTTSTQAFQFKTDNQPPATLAPYVLCSSPDQSEQFAFYEDPLTVLFNDNSVFSLYKAYGFDIVPSLHAADGLPDLTPNESILNTSPSPLQAINGFGPATYDSMLQVAQGFSCLGGSLTQYQNQLYTAPVNLRPLMGYTFDLLTSPGPGGMPSAGSPASAVTPLFRRNFSTGRYANLQALAADLGTVIVTHRALSSALSFPVSGGAQVLPDADIQQAFLNGDEQALPAPATNAIVIYWLASEGGFVPHAVLIDSIEPLWRYRPAPAFTMPIASDSSFKIVTIAPAASLQVSEPTAAIGSFVVSPGGARTVGMFKAGFAPPTAGTQVTLQLERPASNVYGNADETATIVQLLITPQAPWENDHV
jgi:hypothetical protein